MTKASESFYIHWLHRAALIVLATLALTLLASCGGDEDAEKNNSKGGKSNTRNAKAEKKPPTPRDICKQNWQAAAKAASDWNLSHSNRYFKQLSEALQSIPVEVTACEERSEVEKTIEEELRGLRKVARTPFDYAQFLLRILPHIDGNLAEQVCAEGPGVLKENPYSFLKAMKEAKVLIADYPCLVRAKPPGNDRAPADVHQEMLQRIRALNTVSDPELKDYREGAVDLIRSRMSSQ